MKEMIYTSKRGRKIVFDDFTDNTEEYQSYWAEMCPKCHNKYRGILGNRCDRSGSMGTCSVKGCERIADYYVDFAMTEVAFTMSVAEYIDKHFAPVPEIKTPQQKATAYLVSRLEDFEIDFGEESEVVAEFKQTELTTQILSNLERLCTEFYDTMCSSDVDYILEGHSYKELLGMVTTTE